MSGAMVTTQFDNLSLNISKNLKIYTQAAYTMFPDEWKSIIKPERADLKINKQQRYEGGGQAGQIDEGNSARQKRIYEGYQETSIQKDYGVELPVTFQQRRFVIKNANFMQQMAYYNARSMKLVKENDSANVINNGFSTSYLGGDGQPYFDSDHLFKSDSSTYDNLLNPVDMGRDAFEDALIKIAATKMESNIPMNLVAQKVHYSTDNIFTIRELLVTVKDPESANNTHNAITDFKLGHNLNHYLTDTDGYVFDTQINTRTLHVNLPTMFDQYMEDSTKNLIERGWTAQATMFHDQGGSFGSQGG